MALGKQGRRGKMGQQGKQGESGEKGDTGKESIHPWRWRALTLWCILTWLMLWYIFSTLQDSREYACRQSYMTMQKILDASVGGRTLTPERLDRLNELKKIADPSQCKERTELR